MTHARAEIRAKVVDRLMNLSTTADRVYPGRSRKLEASHDPTLLVYTVDETAGRPQDAAAIGRTLTLLVEGRVSAADPPDDLLDTIASEVEARLLNCEDELDVFDITLQRTAIEVTSDGRRHIGEINLFYLVRYNEPAEAE
jgi:hypothetical protein